MKIPCLCDFASDYEVTHIDDPNCWIKTKVVTHYGLPPSGDTLVAVGNEMVKDYYDFKEPITFDLKPIGAHPIDPFSTVCSRSDCGLFWRSVAITKYWLFLAQARFKL